MLEIPKLSQLYNQIVSDLEAELGSSIPLVGPAMVRAIAAVQAAKMYIGFRYIASVQKNIFVDTADPEASGGTLERFGRVKLGRNPFAAQAGQYVLTVTGSNGATIPAGTTFKSDDSALNPGVLYILDSAHTMVGTTDTITVRCLTAGSGGALSDGDTLTATAPIALVNRGAVVNSESVAPLPAETVEEYRTMALNSYRLEPQGGAATDYRLWSQDAAGVKTVYPYVKSDAPSEINLYVEATIDASEDDKGTPGSAILAEVFSVNNTNPDTTISINERGRRPMGVTRINCLPVTPLTVNISIAGLTGRTTALQDSIESAMTEMINNVRPYVSGLDVLSSKNDILDKNKIIGVILSVKPGAIFTGVTLTVDGDSVDTFTFENGDIPWLDTPISYT